MKPLLAVSLLLFSAAAAFPQDLREIKSPDGQIDFRIFIASQSTSPEFRIAYQVDYRGKPLLDTSYLGLEILMQPLLGEKDGLIGFHTGEGPGYRSMTPEYMQNGSLGRRINVEVRVYNSGIAFRYVLPKSGPLLQLFLDDEATEFSFVGDPKIGGAGGSRPLSEISEKSALFLPVTAELPGAAVAIAEADTQNYPRTRLMHSEGTTLLTRLARNGGVPDIALESTTPFVGPWRVVLIGDSAAHLMDSGIVAELNREK